MFEETRPGVLALTVLLACLIGPVAEELLFRGVLYPALRRRLSRVAAMLISGIAFALIHTNVMGLLPIVLLGVTLAYLYERTGSIAGPIALHMAHNTLLMALAMTYRSVMS